MLLLGISFQCCQQNMILPINRCSLDVNYYRAFRMINRERFSFTSTHEKRCNDHLYNNSMYVLRLGRRSEEATESSHRVVSLSRKHPSSRRPPIFPPVQKRNSGNFCSIRIHLLFELEADAKAPHNRTGVRIRIVCCCINSNIAKRFNLQHSNEYTGTSVRKQRTFIDIVFHTNSGLHSPFQRQYV